MKSSIKRYLLNDDISIEKLKENGFKEGGFMREIKPPKYYFNRNLYSDIDLHIEIGINQDNTYYFDDINSVIVIDNSFCQPYYPFYTDDMKSSVLDEVIKAYNEVMNDLVKKGILKQKQQKKTNYSKKLIKK